MPNPQIVDYIRRNRSRYTEEALRAELLSQGYARWEIDEAFEVMVDPGERQRWSDTFGQPRFWLTYLGVLGGSAFALLSGVVTGQLAGLVVVAVLVLLFFGALSGGLDQPIRRACGCALVTLLFTPVLVFGGLYAYCLLNQSSMTF